MSAVNNDTPILAMSKEDRLAYIKRVGEKQYVSELRAELKGREVKLR